jgi:hypothetical protein
MQRSRALAPAAVLAFALLAAACGGPGLPDDGKLVGPPALAPLDTGARWTYRVTDPLRGTFDKEVEVVGPSDVPESSRRAILVRDVEPTGEERGWVEVSDGLLVRHREEDVRAGLLVRATTWTPGAPKLLAAAADAGFSREVTVHEREWHPDGSVSEKDPAYLFTVVATGVSVTVPAGTYTCLQLDRQRLDKVEPKRTYWLAPGVGKVREVSDRVEELVRYVPAR